MSKQENAELMEEPSTDRPRSTHPGARASARPVRQVFYGTGVIAGLLILLAATGGRGGEAPETPFHVPDATSHLLETRLPMEVNDRVERWVNRFLNQDREGFEEYLVREGLYGAMIRDKLRSRDMPEQLLYLAMIESGFSPAATSPVAASGIWQFMGATARGYGLVVDAWVDERRDPVRATDAALDYLEELYEEFGSWYLAAAAYNAGPARVQQAMRQSGVSSETDEAVYWTIIDRLPRETREYVPKILAAALLAEQAEHFGFDVEQSLPYLFDRVVVPGGVSLAEIAASLELPTSLLREMNPHLIRGATPPGRSVLVRVPVGESQRVVASLSRL